ncbi:MAG TPA: DUF378 domain-containing protein [Candidatus Moranbacteria bacterium]|nr:DUF378 domain-containing protein [Candidatus Moranbacteria bacterium]
MKSLNVLDWIVVALLIVGGLNWGILGFFGVNVIGAIFGEMTMLTRIIYGLVGLSAIYGLFIPSKITSGEYMGSHSMKGSSI